MLYYFLYQILFRRMPVASESYFYKGLNVFQYVTFRTCMGDDNGALSSLCSLEKLSSES
jgi:hypothetical protein